MWNLALRAMSGVCLLTAPFCCGDACGGQGLSNLTPAKEYIYLGNQMIAIEMAAPGMAARTAAAPGGALQRAQMAAGTAQSGSGQSELLLLFGNRSKLPLQQGYAAQLKQAIASGAPAVNAEGSAR